MDELSRARTIIARMLEMDFAGAEVYREQLEAATLTRHETGCGVLVDRARVRRAPYDSRYPGARLEVEGAGHGKLRVWLHGFEGYLDDVELLNARHFPDPATVRTRPA